MENVVKNNQELNKVELARMFEVEELEERVEFAKWSLKAGYSEDKGAYGEVGVTFG